jgi:hypothetical protein
LHMFQHMTQYQPCGLVDYIGTIILAANARISPS